MRYLVVPLTDDACRTRTEVKDASKANDRRNGRVGVRGVVARVGVRRVAVDLDDHLRARTRESVDPFYRRFRDTLTTSSEVRRRLSLLRSFEFARLIAHYPIKSFRFLFALRYGSQRLPPTLPNPLFSLPLGSVINADPPSPFGWEW